MADLLLELFSEEIPSGMQARAAQDLARLVGDGLKEAGLESGDVKTFYGARRLTLMVEGLAEKSADVSEERKGPRVGSPEKAIEGFLRAAGLSSVDEAGIASDEKKGDFYVARIEKPGRATADVIAELVPAVIRSFPWPKSQRWGSGSLRWVRPLHSIICLLGGKVVPFEIDGIASSDTTRGHRFMSEGAIAVKDFADYGKKLRAAHVILDAAERQTMILDGAKGAAKKAGLELVEDEALLAEAAGLVEWPVALMGSFDESFLDLPSEVIVTAIRKHQKCFSLKEARSAEGATGTGKEQPKSGKLASNFILVANIEAEDGGKAIIAGNERVVRARLSDAKFFWDQDRSRRLDDLLPELGGIIFHEKLGTQAERVERLKALARELAPIVGADPAKAERAAELSKADLVTGMVGEFPDLQGLMGKYYALDQGENGSVALAIEEHYKPAGQNDSVPTDPVSIAVALADKLDTLVGFWAIDEKPTGSKDPYALRRAALGVIRIVLENGLRANLLPLFHIAAFKHARKDLELLKEIGDLDNLSPSEFREWLEHRGCYWPRVLNAETGITTQVAGILVEFPRIAFCQQTCDWAYEKTGALPTIPNSSNADYDLLAFFHDRLKVYLRDRGARHDLIDAVLSAGGREPTSPSMGEVGAQGAPGGGDAASESASAPPTPTLPHKGGGSAGGDSVAFQDDLLMIVARVEALGKFLDTDDGANLLVGVKRAQNILRIEEKKEKRGFTGEPDSALLEQDEEKALAKAIDEASASARAAIAKEDFEGAMSAIAKLRAPVDAFFDHVTVNADDPKLRENRLRLLNRIREATLTVADFSRISG